MPGVYLLFRGPKKRKNTPQWWKEITCPPLTMIKWYFMDPRREMFLFFFFACSFLPQRLESTVSAGSTAALQLISRSIWCCLMPSSSASAGWTAAKNQGGFAPRSDWSGSLEIYVRTLTALKGEKKRNATGCFPLPRSCRPFCRLRTMERKQRRLDIHQVNLRLWKYIKKGCNNTWKAFRVSSCARE